MRSLARDVRTYRIHALVPCVGIVGLAFLTYVALYGTGIIDWRLFPMVDDFRPIDRHDLGYLAISAAMGVYLLSSVCIKVTITTSGFQYRRWFRPVRMLWSDVTRLTYAPHGIDICLWTKRDCVRFGQYLSKGRDLLGTVKERVSANAPDAEIMQAQPKFLPRWRKSEHGVD